MSKAKGIICPSCGCGQNFVRNVEHLATSTRRRRVCRNCGRVFVTLELSLGKAATAAAIATGSTIPPTKRPKA